MIQSSDRESDGEMATQPERLAALETNVKAIKGIAFILVPLILGWAAYMTVNVISMKQALVDGGYAKLVAQLEKPASTEQLRANLSTVVAQVQTARVNATRPNLKKVKALSDAVSNVVTNQPTLPEAWQAAAQLISYRSDSAGLLPDAHAPCGESNNPGGIHVHFTGGPPGADMVGSIVLSNCTLDLDRATSVWASLSSQVEAKTLNGETITDWHLFLHNVIVHYSGGPLLYVGQITCDHCVFDFRFQIAPPPIGRRMTETLLASNDINDVFLDLPSIKS
jgi:hypothetical protein